MVLDGSTYRLRGKLFYFVYIRFTVIIFSANKKVLTLMFHYQLCSSKHVQEKFLDHKAHRSLLSKVILASLESMAIFTQKRGVPDNWNYFEILKIFQILKFLKLIEAYLVGYYWPVWITWPFSPRNVQIFRSLNGLNFIKYFFFPFSNFKSFKDFFVK